MININQNQLYWDIFITVTAFILGHVSAVHLQKKQFKKERKEEKEKLKNLIKIIIYDLETFFNNIYVHPREWHVSRAQNYLINYKEFDFMNREAIWPELAKSSTFGQEQKLFMKINVIYTKVKELNIKVKELLPHVHTLEAHCIDYKNTDKIIQDIKEQYCGNKWKHGFKFSDTELYKDLNKILQKI